MAVGRANRAPVDGRIVGESSRDGLVAIVVEAQVPAVQHAWQKRAVLVMHLVFTRGLAVSLTQ